MKKIVEICLDTGVLLVGDLISLKRMKQTPHQPVRQFVHSQHQQTYTQGVDFQKFTDPLLDNLSVNELLAQSPVKDVEKNLRVMLSGMFTRLDLVTREEFEVQQEVVKRTREKLAGLEARVAELEASAKPEKADVPAETLGDLSETE